MALIAGSRSMTRKIKTNKIGDNATRKLNVFINPADTRICSILPLEGDRRQGYDVFIYNKFIP
jgi:hypothetical protein